MKLLEIGEVTKHETPGKITGAFGQYLGYVDDWFPARSVQQLKGLAAALIRQGFHFEQHEHLQDSASFTKGPITVKLPGKGLNQKDQGKVWVQLGPGVSRSFHVTTARASKLRYDALERAYKAVRDAELELAMMLR